MFDFLNSKPQFMNNIITTKPTDITMKTNWGDLIITETHLGDTGMNWTYIIKTSSSLF